MNIALWIVQGLLALVFLFSGGMKFVMSIEEMTKQMSMPGWFLHFIGVRPALTPLAAAGLVIIMIGATVVTVMIGGVAMALLPLVTGALAAFVAYGRWRLTPARG